MDRIDYLQYSEPRSYDTIGRYMESVRALSLSKRKSWISKMIDADRIYINFINHEHLNDGGSIGDAQPAPIPEALRTAYKRTLFAQIDALNTAFGNEWDMFIKRYTMGEYTAEGEYYEKVRFMLQPVIRFKQLEITNRDNVKRDIRDLFVSIPFICTDHITEIDGRQYMLSAPRKPYGTRTTYFTDEYKWGYVHSHIPRREGYIDSKTFSLSAFCIGGESDLHDLIMELEHNFDKGTFALYLMTIRSLVEYESLEGGPHCRMTEIIGKRVSTVREDNLTMNSHFGIMKGLLASGRFPLNYTLHNDIIKVKEDEHFEKTMRNVLYELGKTRDIAHYNFISKYDSNLNSWFSYSEDSVRRDRRRVKEDRHMVFNGEKIYLTVIPLKEEQNNNNSTNDISTYHVYPKFLKYVATKLEQFLLKATVRSRFARAEN